MTDRERLDEALRVVTVLENAIKLLHSVAWVDSDTCRWCGTDRAGPVAHADLCPLAIIGNKIATDHRTLTSEGDE